MTTKMIHLDVEENDVVGLVRIGTLLMLQAHATLQTSGNDGYTIAIAEQNMRLGELLHAVKEQA